MVQINFHFCVFFHYNIHSFASILREFHSHFEHHLILYQMNAVFGKLILDRIIAKLVEGRARDKQWRVHVLCI